MILSPSYIVTNQFSPSDLECLLFAEGNVDLVKSETKTDTKDADDANKGSKSKRRRRRVPVIQSELGQPHPFYESIAPLRCLLLRDFAPHKYAAMQQMMDHVEVNFKKALFCRFLNSF